MSRNLHKVPNFLSKHSKDVPAFIELPVHYSHYSVDAVLTYDTKKYHHFLYECYSLSDLIYAILHFLALEKYKFNKCLHCGKYFATSSFKQKYCYRKSPYPNYQHLECEPAVRNILQQLRRLRRAINANLNSRESPDYEIFFNESNDIIQNTKEEPSILNVEKAFSYINKERWYKNK